MGIVDKKFLYYAKCKNGDFDVVIANYPYANDNFHICSWQALLEMYPKSKYNYIKLEEVEE